MQLIIQVIGVNKKVEVTSLEEASQAWTTFRDENNIGASAMRGKCGNVVNGHLTIARVHYNGKIEEK